MDWIYDDMMYQECIRLAQQSTGNERFGAILLRDGFIAGEGYNRRPEKDDPIKMSGRSNHAEIDALNAALKRKVQTEVSSVYVAGYFADTSILNIRSGPIYTCTKCPKYLLEHKIIHLFVPTIDGWRGLSIPNALASANDFFERTLGENNYAKRFAVGNSGILLKSFLETITKKSG